MAEDADSAVAGSPPVDGILIELSPPPPVDQRFASTLAGLFAAKGTTPAAVALQLGLDPAFMSRVLSRRQPLPADVARDVASVLGCSLGTLLGAAGLVTGKEGPVYRVALPPEPLLGDVITALPLGRTVPTRVPTRSTVAAWTSGDGVGDGVSAPGIAVVDRSLGVVARVPFAHAGGLYEMAFGPGGNVHAFGNNSWDASVSVVPSPLLVHEVADSATIDALGVAYEASTNAVWIGSGYGLSRVSSLSPSDGAHFAISIGGFPAVGKCVVAFGGYVYAAADAGAHPGGVVKLDPNTSAVVRTWGGMTHPYGIASDGARYLVVVDQTTLWLIDLQSGGSPQALTIVGTTPLVAPKWIAYFGGHFWLSDTTGVAPRLIRFDLAVGTLRANVLANYVLAGATGVAGHVAADVDGFVWVSVPDAGQLRIIDPTGSSGDPTAHVVTVGGSPVGLLLV